MPGLKSIARKNMDAISAALVLTTALVYSSSGGASECSCPEPPGGSTVCEANQLAYCSVRDGVCYSRCTSILEILGSEDQGAQFLQSIGIHDDTRTALGLDVPESLKRRIQFIQLTSIGEVDQLDFQLSNGDRASIQGMAIKDLEGVLGPDDIAHWLAPDVAEQQVD